MGEAGRREKKAEDFFGLVWCGLDFFALVWTGVLVVFFCCCCYFVLLFKASLS